jgi:hypothetical protein
MLARVPFEIATDTGSWFVTWVPAGSDPDPERTAYYRLRWDLSP